MKTLVLALLTLSSVSALACDVKEQLNAALQHLRTNSPKGSKIDLARKDKKFSYSLSLEDDLGSVQETGLLQVVSKNGKCVVETLSMQKQSQGKTKAITATTSGSPAPKLSGEFVSLCFQYQENGKQGYTIKTYSFQPPNGFSVKRQWFKDAGCKGPGFETENEKGSYQTGKENTNNGFNPVGTRETQFTTDRGSDSGLLWLSKDGNKLRLSRGFGDGQNTMLDLMEYKRR